MRNFQPRSRPENERLISRPQDAFGAGAYDDISASKIPQNGVKWLENFIAFPDRLEPRGGTKRWPVSTDGTAAALPAGVVYGQGYHVGHGIMVTQVGTALYAAKYNFAADTDHGLTASAWTQIYPWYNTNAMTGLNASPSQFAEYGEYLVVFNSGGIFAISFSANPTTWWPLNTATPTQRLVTAITTKSDTNKYGYRYLYTMSRIRGAGAAGDRTTSGAVVELESGPVAPDASSFIDYGEIWSPSKVGPTTTSEKYDVWTGNALPAGFDTVAEVSALTNAQFGITVEGTTYNIECNFSGLTSWAEIATAIQTAIRGYLPQMYVSFTSANVFKFYNLVKGDNITAFVAGTAGTDISSMFATGSAVATAWDAPIVLGVTSGKLKAPLGTSYHHSQWTHFSIYRTLDIGEAGVDPITGQGNNKELYIWVADYRILNPFIATVTGTGTSRTITATTSVFSQADVGSRVYIRTGAATSQNGTIAAVASGTVATLTVEEPWVNTVAKASVLGAYYDKIDIMYQTAYTVTCTDHVPADAYIGSAIHWSNGTFSVITGCVAGASYTVADSATRAGLAAGLLSANDIEAQRWFNDTVSDDTLRTRVSNFTLKNRFWQPLPNCNTGIISNGWLLGALRGGRSVYYSQVVPEYSYLWGYYNDAKQTSEYKDLISNIQYSNDNAVVFLYNSIWRIPLNNYIEEAIEEIGEIVFVLTGTAPIAPSVGCVDFSSICEIDSYTMFFISSDNEALLLTYDGAFKLSSDLAKDRFSKRLKLNANYTSVSYDKTNGLIIWLKVSVATDAGGTYTEKTLTKSYRLAIFPDQGVGVSENTGSAWIVPPSRTKAIRVYDANNQLRTLMIDSSDGYMYELTNREGPTSGTVGRRWKDKILIDGTGGTDYLPSVLMRLDEASAKRMFVELLEAHLYVEPFDRSLADSSGYDSSGYPTDLEFDLIFYIDGSTSTVKARAMDALFDGDISLDRPVRGHGIQAKLTANQAEFFVSGREFLFKAEDVADTPAKSQTTEMTQKASLANVDTHFALKNGALLNLVTGKAPTTVPTITTATDPAGGSLAVQLNADTIEDTNKSLSYSGDFSVELTVGSVDATGIIFYIGTGFSIRVYNDVAASPADYKVAVLHNAVTYTHSLDWDGLGWVNITVKRSGTDLIVLEGND